MRIFRNLIAAAAMAVACVGAAAQTSPGWVQGFVPTPAQWNTMWASKQDTLGYVPLNRAGDSMLGALKLAAPNASVSGFNIGVGIAPTSPNNGDFWATTAGIYFRLNGVTYGPIATGASPTGAALSVTNDTNVQLSLSGTPLAALLQSVNVTVNWSSQLSVARGGTGAATAAGARASAGLNIDSLTSVGNANYTILATDRVLTTSVAFTAPRTWTLPAASSVNAGQRLKVIDGIGTITATNTLTVAAAGADTINGAASRVFSNAYDGFVIESDGVSKWYYVVAGIKSGGTGAVTANAARQNLGAYGDIGTGYGDVSTTIANTDRIAYTTAALTAARTWTLPAANVTGKPYAILVTDMAGGVDATNTLTLQRAGADTLNGGTTITLSVANAALTCTADGVSKWSCQSVGVGSGTVTSVSQGTGISLSSNPCTTTCSVSLSTARQTLPTTQQFTSGTSLTYTTPANVLWIEVYLRGAGGGGGAGGTGAASGGNGAATTFSTLSAGGGTQGAGSSATQAPGGTATGGTINRNGEAGGLGSSSVAGTIGCTGGVGGGTGGGPGGISSGTAGANAATSSGAGGGGGGANNGVTVFCGGGGGQGAEVYAIINNPAATYTYTIGVGGSGAVAGTNGSAGGNGANGRITVIEHYN